MVLGWDDALVYAAGAAASAWGANQTAKAAEAANMENEERFFQANSFNADMMRETMKFNSDQARGQLQWQENMANTAYQRQVADMKSAGLNPLLAVAKGNGAAVPAGASGTAHAAQSVAPQPAINALQAGISTGIQLAQSSADIALKRAQVGRETASAGNLQQQTVRIQVELPKLQAEAALLGAQHGTELWKQTVAKAEAFLKDTQDKLARKEIDLVEAQTALEKAKTVLVELAKEEAKNAANAQSSWWMRNVSPYLPDILKSTGAAAGVRGLAR